VVVAAVKKATAHRLEQQQHQMEYGWTEWSKPSACNNVTNQRIFSEEVRKRQASCPVKVPSQ